MSRILFRCAGGDVVLPDARLTLVSREDGGNLIVNPPREVWERSELSADELTQWSFLVAATGKAMLDALPVLTGGCINYWEAGNWALNDDAEPKGPKSAPDHRRVHMHLLGRSRSARSLSWRWGEAPRFPDFKDRFQWASSFERLTAEECERIANRAESILRERYGLDDIAPRAACHGCGYPTPVAKVCAEC